VAVDDTMFRRRGRKVHAAHWGYDGSLKVAKGNQKLSRGNTFVAAAVVVALPFLDRPIALPVLARLWRKGAPTKTMLAREMVETLAAAAGRTVHVVGDGAYLCTELRQLPPNVTLTGPIPRHASLWQEDHQLAKQSTGLDAGQVIRWKSWHRWTAICLLAYVYLAVAVAVQRQHDTGQDLDAGLIPITIPELVRLLRDAVIPPPRRDRAHRLHWSAWRRRCQHRARQAHQRWNAYAETTP
jgi:DDE superfamily endonuclease